ncbi:MAG: TrmB family transcriptional regulator, partial [archaeon]
MSVDGIRDQLKTFGLSEKEVDMYVSVLKHGEAPVKTLADDADISVRYVYDVGEQLEERGLVTMNDHAKPTTIRAKSPGEAVSDLVHQLRTVESGLEALYSEPEPQTSRFEILQSRQTILRRMKSYIQDASDEVLLMVPGSILEHLYEVLEAAIDRDVLVLVLLTGSDLKGPEVMYNRLGEKVSAARVWS